MSVQLLQGAWWAWPLALLFFGLFRLWYVNWRRPLSSQEIDQYLAKAHNSSGAAHSELSSLRQFLEQDDGREFLMANMIRLRREPTAHPVTGVMTEPRDLLQIYFRAFLGIMLRKGGHPVIATRKIAGYLDAWGAHPDEHWSLAAMVRYRSRRDFLELAIHPNFMAAHPFKVAAIDRTYSFPTHPVTEMVLRPSGIVGLVLFLSAALVHLASLLTMG